MAFIANDGRTPAALSSYETQNVDVHLMDNEIPSHFQYITDVDWPACAEPKKRAPKKRNPKSKTLLKKTLLKQLDKTTKPKKPSKAAQAPKRPHPIKPNVPKTAKKPKMDFEVTSSKVPFLNKTSVTKPITTGPSILLEMTSEFAWELKDELEEPEEIAPTPFITPEPCEAQPLDDKWEPPVEMEAPDEFPTQFSAPQTACCETQTDEGDRSACETQTEETIIFASCETQTDDLPEKSPSAELVQSQEDKLNRLKEELLRCKKEKLELRGKLWDIRRRSFQMFDPTIDAMKNNNALVHFYTGMTNLTELRKFYEKCVLIVPLPEKRIIPRFSEFLMVMMQLRLNVTFADLSVQFKLDEDAVDVTCTNWVDGMFECSKSLIEWPSQSILRSTVPEEFSNKYGDCTSAIVTTFDVVIPTPSAEEARQQTWSSRMQAHTIKYLISATPQGKINFISEGWGGLVTDKLLAKKSGFLKYLEKGDHILIKKGFGKGLDDYLEPEGCEIVECDGTDEDYFLIERLVKKLKFMFPILADVIPMYLVTKKGKNGLPLIDKVVRICCAILNMTSSLVEQDEVQS